MRSIFTILFTMLLLSLHGQDPCLPPIPLLQSPVLLAAYQQAVSSPMPVQPAPVRPTVELFSNHHFQLYN